MSIRLTDIVKPYTHRIRQQQQVYLVFRPFNVSSHNRHNNIIANRHPLSISILHLSLTAGAGRQVQADAAARQSPAALGTDTRRDIDNYRHTITRASHNPISKTFQFQSVVKVARDFLRTSPGKSWNLADNSFSFINNSFGYWLFLTEKC